MPLIYIAAWF